MLKWWGQIALFALWLAACTHLPDMQPAISPASSQLPVLSSPLPTARSTDALHYKDLDATQQISSVPIPTPSGPPIDLYVVQPGDTLSAIAYNRCGCDVEELMALNQISDATLLQVGQRLRIPVRTKYSGPMLRLLPDSEVVYSPAYRDFDIAGFVKEQGGYLARYTERVNGRVRTGAEVVQLVAQTFSVGPRVLLALLEYQSKWVTGEPDSQVTLNFPLSHGHGGQSGLYFQLGWAANRINEGYYTYKREGTFAFRLLDRKRVLAAQGLNAGTVGIQNVLAPINGWEDWQKAVDRTGFLRTYEILFGDPHRYAIEPLIPAGLEQPALYLPWPEGHTWYLSGGPHGAWFSGSAWAALDFAPPDVVGHCAISQEWATAAASGLVVRSEDGQVLIDLDEDGYEQTGWVLFYLHIASLDRVPAGTRLVHGDRVGHPSCEGGVAESSHLHIARRYNGEWIAADGPIPLVLSGWRAINGLAEYEGKMVKGDQIRQACECWETEINGIVSDNPETL
ncbi:MAG: LysM peptidoglycan-binding domain-containing protein [Anaerolineae bacterium]